MFNSFPGADFSTPDYRYAAIVRAGEASVEATGGFPKYAGTLVLDILPDAEGTFTLALFDPPSTFLLDENNTPIVIETVPAKIVVVQCAGPDCQPNGVADNCDLISGDSLDCNSNTVPDECDLADGTSNDCNTNAMPDACDLAVGFSLDCNNTGIPDSCEIADETAADCNGNRVPDECDLDTGPSVDCNGNAVPDVCDLFDGTSGDCNLNGVPDECERDSDSDGVIDVCDECPADPGKTLPGVCGCGVPDTDSDGDTVADCVDVCLGADDRIDRDGNGAPDCAEGLAIPALANWGLVVLGLLLLAAAKIRFGRLHARS